MIIELRSFNIHVLSALWNDALIEQHAYHQLRVPLHHHLLFGLDVVGIKMARLKKRLSLNSNSFYPVLK